MRRDRLLVAEMIDAAERAVELVGDRSVEEIEGDRLRREALLWTFTVLDEASTSVSDELKQRFSDVPWRNPIRLRNRVVHGYWSVEGRKMSKSLGNVVGAYTLADKYGREAIRYFVLREMAFGLDADFSEEAFVGWMNEKAKELELTHTHFRNSTGLNEASYPRPPEVERPASS